MRSRRSRRRLQTGHVKYEWAPKDLEVGDLYELEFEIQWSTSHFQSVPNDGYRYVLVEEDVLPHFDFDRMYDLLLKRGFTVYPGRLMEKKTIRFANIGDINEGDMLRFLDNLKEVLSEMNVRLK